MTAKKSNTAYEDRLIEKALSHGAQDALVIPPSEVVTAEWVRWKCHFGCGGFGSSLVCPPHSPAPERTRRLLDCYSVGILFRSPHGEAKRIAAELEKELFLDNRYKAFGMGAGPCRLCESCAFEEGCRHPQKARPAMEACGIDVFSTVRNFGFEINVVKDRCSPQKYFGLVLVE